MYPIMLSIIKKEQKPAIFYLDMSLQAKINTLYEAAQDKGRVQGLTHNFYRYPARFSPQFARTAIELFSKPGDVVLDPYVGGGTTIVEASVLNRIAIGVDLNSLACFVSKVKTTTLNDIEKLALNTWAQHLKSLNYHHKADPECLVENKIKNLDLLKARFIKKIVALAISSIKTLPTLNSQNFARCVILNTAQWALDGRSKSFTSVRDFRNKLLENYNTMMIQHEEYNRKLSGNNNIYIFEKNSSLIDTLPIFANKNLLADLVVTSPP